MISYYSQTCTGRGPIITVKPVLVEDQLLVKPVLVEDQLLVKPVLVEDQLLVKPVLVEDQLLQSNLYWLRTNYYSQTCTGHGPIITVKPVLVEDQLFVLDQYRFD
jgi:hypothetical protein